MTYTDEPFMIAELKAVRECLDSMGYKTVAADEPVLRFCLASVRNAVKNTIHCKNIPKGLEYIVIRRAVGEFLKSKKAFAPGDLTMLDIDCAVKQMQVGDTNITFAVGSGSFTPEQRLDHFISGLLNTGQDEMMHYRRLKW